VGYIGAEPATSFETVRKDRFTSQTGTTVTLSHTVSSVNDILVMVNSVKQDYTNYSVNGTTLTLGGSLVSADIVEVTYIGRTFQTVSPDTNTITNAMMSDDAIDSAEIVDGAVDSVHTNFVSTSSAAGLQIKGDGTTDGTLQLNCSQNSHGIKIKSPPHSASASYTLTMPNNDGSANEYLQTNGSGVLTWAGVSGTTINNNADNKVITGSGTANTLEGEANLQFDGTNLGIGTSPSRTLDMTSNGDYFINLNDGTNASVGSTNRGVNLYAGGSIPLKLRTNEVEVTSKLGIGEDAPQQKLHIGEASSNGVYQVFTNDTTGHTASNGLLVGIDNSEDALIWNYENQSIYFGTNGSERMRIHGNGYLLMGGKTTSNTANVGIELHGNQIHSTRNDAYSAYVGRNNATAGKVWQGINTAGNESSWIKENGSGYMPNGWSSSDSNGKNIIGEVTHGLDKLNQVTAKSFTWKTRSEYTADDSETQNAVLYTAEDVLPEGKSIGDIKTPSTKQLGEVKYLSENFDDNKHYGVIAQELKTILPDIVHFEEPELRVDYDALLMVAINSIKELSTKNNALETKVTTLETNVSDLTTRLEALENA